MGGRRALSLFGLQRRLSVSHRILSARTLRFAPVDQRLTLVKSSSKPREARRFLRLGLSVGLHRSFACDQDPLSFGSAYLALTDSLFAPLQLRRDALLDLLGERAQPLGLSLK